MKMNKKGFTLIEMLVVIAIIAVLVSIIIPVVSNSTTKAEAATDAANLRSAKASLAIYALDMSKTERTTYATGDKDDFKTITGTDAPVSKMEAGDFSFTISDLGAVEVKFGNATIQNFADVAEGTQETVPAKS